ncbi:MAG: transposase [Elusimicrobia bacterium]|nr:transposase [Elusimicrobiota bacterium]
MKRVKPVIGQFYHVFNRGVDKRIVFSEEIDYIRFIHDLYEFNDTKPAPNLTYYINYKRYKEVGLPYIHKEARKCLVEIIAFCLMPNHFHLMLRSKIDGGITEFMRKIGSGYTNYFNQKYRRTGSLFQGKYKIVHINQEAHFLHLPFYIHSNPLNLILPEWKDKNIKNYRHAFKFLKKYRWSSLLDYIGIKNFPSLIQKNFLDGIVSGPENFELMFLDWLKDFDSEEAKDFLK